MKKAFLIAALVTALVLSGCIQPTSDFAETEPTSVPLGQETVPQNNQQPDNQQQLVQCPDGSMAVSLELCIGSEEQSPVNTDSESCGSIDITNVVASTYLTGEEENLSCFNQNMASCIDSTLELTGMFGVLFSVLGEDGDNCLISYYDNTDSILKTCKFPKIFLETTVQSSEQANQPNLPILVVSGVMQGQPNPITGEPIEIECS